MVDIRGDSLVEATMLDTGLSAFGVEIWREASTSSSPTWIRRPV